ncbi:hypothetical protein L210DRAFT_3658971 [Boletus edulis BED1]|uniref:Uncharacterized protein n=1 Tax=Boletus edulis BED1 TaxID=1328754 RepID=A0AAD4BA67_BOLED|nr:hypothetical protein L210DRAFT_3658971 [Boletus edulis BED1]
MVSTRTSNKNAHPGLVDLEPQGSQHHAPPKSRRGTLPKKAKGISEIKALEKRLLTDQEQRSATARKPPSPVCHQSTGGLGNEVKEGNETGIEVRHEVRYEMRNEAGNEDGYGNKEGNKDGYGNEEGNKEGNEKGYGNEARNVTRNEADDAAQEAVNKTRLDGGLEGTCAERTGGDDEDSEDGEMGDPRRRAGMCAADGSEHMDVPKERVSAQKRRTRDEDNGDQGTSRKVSKRWRGDDDEVAMQGKRVDYGNRTDGNNSMQDEEGDEEGAKSGDIGALESVGGNGGSRKRKGSENGSCAARPTKKQTMPTTTSSPRDAAKPQSSGFLRNWQNDPLRKASTDQLPANDTETQAGTSSSQKGYVHTIYGGLVDDEDSQEDAPSPAQCRNHSFVQRSDSPPQLLSSYTKNLYTFSPTFDVTDTEGERRDVVDHDNEDRGCDAEDDDSDDSDGENATEDEVNMVRNNSSLGLSKQPFSKVSLPPTLVTRTSQSNTNVSNGGAHGSTTRKPVSTIGTAGHSVAVKSRQEATDSDTIRKPHSMPATRTVSQPNMTLNHVSRPPTSTEKPKPRDKDATRCQEPEGHSVVNATAHKPQPKVRMSDCSRTPQGSVPSTHLLVKAITECPSGTSHGPSRPSSTTGALGHPNASISYAFDKNTNPTLSGIPKQSVRCTSASQKASFAAGFTARFTARFAARFAAGFVHANVNARKSGMAPTITSSRQLTLISTPKAVVQMNPNQVDNPATAGGTSQNVQVVLGRKKAKRFHNEDLPGYPGVLKSFREILLPRWYFYVASLDSPWDIVHPEHVRLGQTLWNRFIKIEHTLSLKDEPVFAILKQRTSEWRSEIAKKALVAVNCFFTQYEELTTPEGCALYVAWAAPQNKFVLKGHVLDVT